MKKAKTGKDLRTVRGLLINPAEQLRLSFWIGGGCLVVMMAILGILMFSINLKISAMETTYNLDSELAYTLKSSVTFMMILATGFTALLTVFSIAAGVKMTHRIFGPMVPFLRHIEALKTGNYKSRVHLREGDAHTELMASLNELAEKLEKN